MKADNVFADFLAARVHELNRELANARSEIGRVRRSRDLWRQRSIELTNRYTDNGARR